jgi:predicted secreted protein
MISRSILLAGAASAALFALPAYAADAAADEPQTTSVGTGASDDSSEITVTARRRLETAQEVPLAISVIGGEHIDNTGAFNIGRLQQLTPTLQYTSSNPRNTTLAIRGIGTPFGLTNDGFDQGVGIYVDDVYYSRAASSTFDFLDVAQVEVLRGPQGTLYGKNTTAGAVNITTRAPTFNFETRGEATVGNLGFTQVKLAASGPLTDNLAVRLASSYTTRRGTIYNIATGQYINEQDNLGIRAQVLWKPTSNVEVTLAGDYSTQNPECCGTSFVRTVTTAKATNRQYAALAAAQGYTTQPKNVYDRLTDIDASLNAGNKIGGASLRIKWNTGPGTLTSVTAYRFWDWKPENDRDFTGLPITIKSQNPSQQSQLTQEFRYNYSKDRIDFVVGLFGYKQKVRTQGTEQLGSAATKWTLAPSNDPANNYNLGILNNLLALNNISLDNSSAALFGQLSWKITDRLTIQPGIRVNYDKKEGLYARLHRRQPRQRTDRGHPGLGCRGAARCADPADRAGQLQRLELQLRLQRELQDHAERPDLCDLCEELQDRRHQPQRRAEPARRQPEPERRLDQAGIDQPLRNRPEVAVLGSQGHAEPVGLPHRHPGLSGAGEQRRDLDRARLSRQCRQGPHPGSRSGVLGASERPLQPVLQRRLYRCQVHQLRRCAVPAGTLGRYADLVRRLGPAPAGRVEVLGLLWRRVQRAQHGVRQGRAVLRRRGRQLPDGLLVQRQPVGRHQDRRLCPDQLPRGLPHGLRDRHLRLGPQRLRHAVPRTAADRAGQHRPDRGHRRRSAHLRCDGQVALLSRGA